jgi:hypothetical protein
MLTKPKADHASIAAEKYIPFRTVLTFAITYRTSLVSKHLTFSWPNMGAKL